MNYQIRQALLATVASMPVALSFPVNLQAQEIQSFAIIAGQSLTNTGPTTIRGNIAVSPGVSYTGSGSVTQTGTAFVGDAVSVRIQNDLTTLYTYLAGRPTKAGGNLTGQELGGKTLTPGVYNFDTSAGLSAGQTLTLDGGGNPDAIFIINIGSTLTVGSGARVLLQNGAQGGNVFYRVGSSATLNTSSSIVGQVVALTSISLNTTATLGCGAAYARNGSVTLDSNTIGRCVLDGTSFVDVGTGGGTPATPGGGTPAAPGGTPTTPGGGTPTTPGGTPTTPDGMPATPGGPTPTTPDTGTPATPTNPSGGDTSPFSGNAQAVLLALSEFQSDGGLLPISIAILPATQTPAELADSLGQFTGEASTGVAKMGRQSMDTFMDTVRRSALTRRAPVPAPLVTNTPDIPVGLVPDRTKEYSSKLQKADVAPAVAPPETIAPIDTLWNFWGTGYGTRRVTDGNTAIGSHDLTIETTGLAVGLDYALDTRTIVGVAVALDSSRFDLNDDFGDGSGDGLLATLYGKRTFEKLYVEGAFAIGRNDFSTSRVVTIAGQDRFEGEGTSKSVAAYVEAGYDMGVLTPFLAIHAQRQTVPGYDEEATLGASTFALRYGEMKADSFRTDLGAEVRLAGGNNAALDLRAAWSHEFADVSPQQASFQAVPGVSFPVTGATLDRNALRLSSTASFGSATGFYGGGSVDAEYSNNSDSYGGALTLGIRW